MFVDRVVKRSLTAVGRVRVLAVAVAVSVHRAVGVFMLVFVLDMLVGMCVF